MLEKMTETIAQFFSIEKQPFRRQLSPEELQRLAEVCSAAFSSKINPEVLNLIAQYCVYVEQHMHGRAAGHIEDLVLRYLFRYFSSLIDTTQYKDPCHMEIGVLFGAATIYAYNSTKLAEKDYPIIAIDPFEGYYGIEKDPATNLRVDEETFLKNLQTFKIPAEKIEIIKDYSNRKSVISRCENKQVLSLLIDGDHSYEGVKSDWLNYSSLIVPGGYVLIDDYNNTKRWPGIFECLNKEILPHLWGKWEIALIYGSTIILRRTDIKEDRDTSDFQNLYRELITYEKRSKELATEIEQLAFKKRELEEENANLKSSLRTMKNSISWRITAPMRKVKKLWNE